MRDLVKSLHRTYMPRYRFRSGAWHVQPGSKSKARHMRKPYVMRVGVVLRVVKSREP